MKERRTPKFTAWIKAEHWAEGERQPVDDNSDVIVTLEDGSRWFATFFSYANIASLTQKNKQTGECLGGKYLWAAHMILVDEVTRAGIEEVVSNLLVEHSFESAFFRCPDAEDTSAEEQARHEEVNFTR